MGFSDIHIGLVIKHFSGELSEVEKKKLFEWVYSSTANEKHFYNLKDVWETAQYEKITKNAHTNEEWDKFLVKAIKEESDNYKRKLVSIQIMKKVLQIAAIIIITFGVGFFANKLIPPKQDYTTINVPYGAKSQIELADGSQIWINSGSKLTYPDNLNQKEVNLYLEGEAFFDIVKNKKRALNVNTSTISIKVQGTAFNVRSYEDDDDVETTLVRGSISVTGSVGTKSIVKPIVLKPNQQATLIKGSQDFQVKEMGKDQDTIISPKKVAEKTIPEKPSLSIKDKVDVNEFISWKNNQLVFKSQRFDELLMTMERWYDVDIVLEDKELSSSIYTGAFDKETIEQAMNALSLSLPFKYEIDKNRIVIKKKL